MSERKGGEFLANIINARNIVFLAMLAVGGPCAYMSARNTSGYLVLIGRDESIAIMTGVAFIIFAAMSITASGFFWKHGGLARIMAVIIIFAGIVVILISISATLGLNYHQFVNSEVMQAEITARQAQDQSEILSAVSSEAADVSQWTRDSIDRLLALSEASGNSWATSMSRIIEATENITPVQEVVEAIHVEIIPATFFDFALRLNEFDRKYLADFLMLALPAVLYDILTALAVSCCLFLMHLKPKKDPKVIVAESAADTPLIRRKRKSKIEIPDIKDLTAYIENAMQEGFQILPDDAIPYIDAQKCARFRKYLSSFKYKGESLVSETDGQYVSVFDKENLIRFITLQSNVQRQWRVS
jgi:hypothetical protein